jgi:hypothetical protein
MMTDDVYSSCPFCDFVITVDDLNTGEVGELTRLEIEHMEAKHPEIIAEGLRWIDISRNYC